MSRIESAVSGALAGGLAFAVLQIASPTPDAPTAELRDASGVAPAAAAPEKVETDDGTTELRMRLSVLEERVGQLGMDLAGAAVAREAVAAVEAPDEVIPAGSAAPTEQQRQLVLNVLEEQRLAEARERQEERVAREEARALSRAERAAEELGLSSGELDSLARIWTEEGVARMELFESMRDMPPGNDVRDMIRDEMQALRDAADEQIVLSLGSEKAAALEEFESSNRGGGRFGNFGPRNNR